MRNRTYPPFWGLLLTLVATLPAIAQSESPAQANTDAATQQNVAAQEISQRPGAVVKVVKHEGEAPSMRSLIVVRDAETGTFRAPNDEEWARLASSVTPLNRSDAGLTETYYADGTVGVDLQGRFQSLMTVHRHGETTDAACTHSASSAASFLVAPPATTQGISSSPVKEASDVR